MTIRLPYFLLALTAFSLSALAEQEIASSLLEEAKPLLPDAPQVGSAGLNKNVLIDQCNGLYLMSPKEKTCTDLPSGIGFSKELSIPGKAEELKRKLNRFLGKCPLTKEDLIQIKGVIQKHWKENNHPILVVEVPAQDCTGGVLQIMVREATLGSIHTIGNQHVKGGILIDYLHEKPGETIDEARLFRDIGLINRNPFRVVNLVYSPGLKEGTTDIYLAVSDKKPFRAYVGADNSGVKSVDRNRLFVGFNYGNMFGSDQVFSYQYTSAPHLHTFYAHTAQFSTPLPWGHFLSANGGFSEVHAKIGSAQLKSRGSTAQCSLQYAIPLNQIGLFVHEIDLTFDFKRTDNTVAFGDDTSIHNQTVNMTQVGAGYQFDWAHKLSQNLTLISSFDAQVHWSPGGWIPHQKHSDFEALREGARPDFVYLKTTLSEKLDFSPQFSWELLRNTSLLVLFRGQDTNRNLPPSEQLGFGGFSSVRGYEEHQMNVDRGCQGTVEFTTAPWGVYKHMFSKRSVDDEMRMVFFFDWSYGKNKKPQAFERKNESLLSAGAGVRYKLSDWLTARGDVGCKLHRRSTYHGGFMMGHFSVVASF